MLTINIPIEPRGKDRARSRYIPGKGSRPGFVSHYTTAATRAHEDAVKVYVQRAMRGKEIFDGPLTVSITAIMPVPASWSNAKWTRACAGIIRPTGKPDGDNIAKSVADACNKIVWRDDAQIVDLRVIKVYGKTPSLVISVRATEPLLLEQDAA